MRSLRLGLLIPTFASVACAQTDTTLPTPGDTKHGFTRAWFTPAGERLLAYDHQADTLFVWTMATPTSQPVVTDSWPWRGVAFPSVRARIRIVRIFLAEVIASTVETLRSPTPRRFGALNS
jgi:hypothetical protein